MSNLNSLDRLDQLEALVLSLSSQPASSFSTNNDDIRDSLSDLKKELATIRTENALLRGEIDDVRRGVKGEAVTVINDSMPAIIGAMEPVLDHIEETKCSLKRDMQTTQQATLNDVGAIKQIADSQLKISLEALRAASANFARGE